MSVLQPPCSLSACFSAELRSSLQILVSFALLPSLLKLSISVPIDAAGPLVFAGVVVFGVVSEQPPRASPRHSDAAMAAGERTRQSLRDLDLAALAARIEDCRDCPRLVAWREQVARERRAAFADQTYWGRPVAGFGDPAARIAILGLAPAAHGANRTGRVFTGDRSGDFLFAALHRARLANQPTSSARGDGLELLGCFVTAAVRCAPPANRPTPAERDRCLPYARRELELLAQLRVLVCLGAFAWDAALTLCYVSASPKPRFAHAAERSVPGGPTLLGCYHPSQQNTFTGRLTEPMIDAVLARGRELAGYKR
jgi:uracil-DNA glycosylase